MNIAKALLEASLILRKAGVPEERREAASLLSHAISKDRTFLISRAEYELSAEELENFRKGVERRAKGEPLQYITGQQDFYGRVFRVSPAVLIPRPETELLVEAALQVLSDSDTAASVCDVGTGSGCIAITLLCERTNLRAMALDISPEALELAKENAIEMGVNDRLTVVLSDCFSSLPDGVAPFELIVSNPPYVSAGVVTGLQREVRDHEPMVALSPGLDGLSIIRRLIDEAPRFLRSDGYLLLEIGFDQSAAVEHLVDRRTWHLIDIRPDLQGIPRIVILRKV